MPNLSPQELQKQVDLVIRLWTANPEVKLKDVTLEQFQAQVVRFEPVLTAIAVKEEELTPLRNDRDALVDYFNDVIVRFRSGVRAYFGGDSTEYELAGGTRSSERKPRRLKSQPETDARKAA